MFSKKIKIAYVTTRFSPELGGPTYNLLFELSKYLEVVCIAIDQDYAINKSKNTIEFLNESLKVVRIRYLKNPLRSDYIIPLNLKKVLDAEEPDIVQVDEFFNFLSIIAGKWAIQNKRKLFINSRMRFRKSFIKDLFFFSFKILSREIVKYASKIISTQGDCSRTEFLRWFPFSKMKIEDIKSGLNINFFKKGAKEYNFRERYGIPKGKKIILSVARMYKVKRIDLLIRAFSRLKKEKKDIILVNIGPKIKEEYLKLKKIASKEGLKEGVDIFFVGSLKNNEIAPAYFESEVFVNTSETEGICFSFLEAMAFKLPILAFDVGGNSGVVSNGKNGYLCKFGDFNKISEKVKILIEDDKLRKRFGENGYQILKEEFDIIKNAKKLRRIFEDELKISN